MELIPVLFDTDIGSDIDDAVALAYLLRQPRCELVGITTVSGDVQQRAALCEMLCAAAGKPDIPIHCGRRDVLVNGPGQPRVPQYEPVADVPHRLDRPENTAVAFLREQILARPGEIVLLSVGPFGNIAALVAQDPTILTKVRAFVSMAGQFWDPNWGEWNCIVDPVSTCVVLADSVALPDSGHTLVGLDVTLKCQLPKDEVKERFNRPLLDLVLRMASAWFKHDDKVTFHDPLAAALVFEPTLCETASGRVTCGLPDAEGKGGITVFTPGAGAHHVCTKVDTDAFFAEYFSRF